LAQSKCLRAGLDPPSLRPVRQLDNLTPPSTRLPSQDKKALQSQIVFFTLGAKTWWIHWSPPHNWRFTLKHPRILRVVLEWSVMLSPLGWCNVPFSVVQSQADEDEQN
jgi:hypothetical protein